MTGSSLQSHADALLFEIGVEIAVTEIRPAVGKNSNIAPFGVVRDMRRLELLADTVFHIVLLGVADLHPAVVVGDRGSGIAITARHSRCLSYMIVDRLLLGAMRCNGD